jgi:hypothetical protein
MFDQIGIFCSDSLTTVVNSYKFVDFYYIYISRFEISKETSFGKFKVKSTRLNHIYKNIKKIIIKFLTRTKKMTTTQKNIQPINNLKTYTVHTILSRPCMPQSEESLEFAQESARIDGSRKTNPVSEKFSTNSIAQQSSLTSGPRMPSLVAGCSMKPKLAPIDDDDELDFSDFPNPTTSCGIASPKKELSPKANSQESPLYFTFSAGTSLLKETLLNGTANSGSFKDERNKTGSPHSVNATRDAIKQLKGSFHLDNGRLQEIKARLNRTDKITNQVDCSQLLKLPKSDPKRQMAESILDRSRMSRRFEIAKKMLAMVGENIKNNK